MDPNTIYSLRKARSMYKKINTKEFCFFCLKPAQIKIEESDERSLCKAGHTSSQSLSIRSVLLLCLCRHLKINLKKVTGNSTFGSDSLQNQEEEVKVNLCNDCEKITKRFSTLYRQLEAIQMEMNYQLKRIHHCISEGAQNPELLQNYSKKMTSDPETLARLAWIDKFRKEISQKCSKSETGLIQTVELQRIKVKNIPKMFSLKQEPNEDSEDDTADGMIPPSPDCSEVATSIETGDIITARKLISKNKREKPSTSKTFTRDPLTRRFHCPSCKKTFTLSHNAKVHYDSIHLMKRWKCDACNTVFKFHYNLLRHKKKCGEILLKRTKDAASRKQFGFPCPTCNKRFPEKRYLQNHLRLVHSKTNFSCDCCGKTFKLLRSLKEHQDFVNLGKTWSCTHCNKEFSTRASCGFHQGRCSERGSVKIKKENY